MPASSIAPERAIVCACGCQERVKSAKSYIKWLNLSINKLKAIQVKIANKIPIISSKCEDGGIEEFDL